MSQKEASMILSTLGQDLRIIVIGASGGIGKAMVDTLESSNQVSHIYALSRNGQSHHSAKVINLEFEITSEKSICDAADGLKENGPFDIIIIATGLLIGEGIEPEKSMRAMSFDAFEKSFLTNAIGPAITAKYFLPLLRRDSKAVFAALSARVGSISDNRLGGWYAYRASKAALNMIIKTLSIEYARRFKEVVIVGFHPGTVDTKLSRPFQANVKADKLFTAEYSAKKLLSVIDQLKANDTGNLFDWAGEKIIF